MVAVGQTKKLGAISQSHRLHRIITLRNKANTKHIRRFDVKGKLVLAMTSLVLAVGSVFAAAPAQAVSFEVGFRNSCHHTVRVAVSVYRADEWHTVGWYTFAPGERAKLNGAHSDNEVFYYYAETLDGTIVWKGTANDAPIVMDGVWYRSKENIASSWFTGTYYTNLTCNSR
jgi:uncharacterized membrane protein